MRLARRQLLAATTGTSAAAAGCTTTDRVSDGPTDSPEQVDDGPPASGRSRTYYASAYDTLNELFERIDTDAPFTAEVILDRGETTFTDSIPWPADSTVVIRGQGMDASVLRSDGSERLVWSRDAGGALRIADCTIDMDHTPSDGRGIGIFADKDAFRLDRVRVQNVDVREQHVNLGFVIINDGTVDRVAITECDWRFDTVQNRDEYKYCIVRVPGGGLVNTFVARDNYHRGTLLGDLFEREDLGFDFLNAYVVRIGSHGLMTGCTFERWGQYCCWLSAERPGASVRISDCLTRNGGGGDQFRVGCRAANTSFTITNCTMGGTGHRDIDPDQDGMQQGDKIQGDRFIVIHGSQSFGEGTVSNCTAYDVMGPLSSHGIRNLNVSNVLLRNVGTLHEDGTQPLRFLNRSADAGYVDLRNVTINNHVQDRDDIEVERTAEYGLFLRDWPDVEYTWVGPVSVRGCTFVGYEETDIEVDGDVEVHATDNYTVPKDEL